MSPETEKIPDDIIDLIDVLAWQVWYMRCECDLTNPMSKDSYEAAEVKYKRAREIAKKYGFAHRIH